MELYEAISRGDEEGVRSILDKGADPNIRVDYQSILEIASVWTNPRISKLVQDARDDSASYEGKFGTALQAAIYWGETVIVQLLLDRGAATNALGQFGTALKIAIAKADNDTIRLLLDRGADVNAQDGEYGTALQKAIRTRDQHIIQFLLDRGADINIQGGLFGTPLQTAIWTQDADTVQFILDKGADINTPDDKYGQTPLHIAVETGFQTAVSKLLHQGATTHVQDFNRETPLELAVRKTETEIAQLLFSKTTNALHLVEASKWRELLPGSGPHIEVISGKPMRMTRQEDDVIEARSYPLTENHTSLRAGPGDFIATDIDSRRIFILANGALLSSSKTGVRSRWWRSERPQNTNNKTLIIPKVRKGPMTEEPLPSFKSGEGRSWRVQPSVVPSKMALTQIKSKDFFVECCFLTRNIMLPNGSSPDWPKLSNDSKLNTEGIEATHGILWIMTRRQGDIGRESPLESRIFFSTVSYTQVPQHPSELFVPLVHKLSQEWENNFQEAESRLATQREELLVANGTKPHLIRDLLGDAQLWALLGRKYKKQISDLEGLGAKYMSKEWAILRENEPVQPGTESSRPEVESSLATELFLAETRKLENQYLEGLRTLRETSRDLIELEFNLTSIAEAQKSRSTNQSMKRLSWITFIFLPLMFISSLFGMNIDLLSSNPPWWCYIPLAAGTTLLTLGVWLGFKYKNSFQEGIKRGFNLLGKRQPQDDPEEGQRQNTLARERTKFLLTPSNT